MWSAPLKMLAFTLELAAGSSKNAPLVSALPAQLPLPRVAVPFWRLLALLARGRLPCRKRSSAPVLLP